MSSKLTLNHSASSDVVKPAIVAKENPKSPEDIGAPITELDSQIKKEPKKIHSGSLLSKSNGSPDAAINTNFKKSSKKSNNYKESEPSADIDEVPKQNILELKSLKTKKAEN